MRMLLIAILVSIAASAWAQSPTVEAAKDFYCTPGKAHANAADDPLITPTKIFDNLYAIGRTSTVVYALTTSDGIVLIDAGYADQLETVLLPGMKALGLDPARIKYIFVTHGHPDHFGGSAVLQQRYGAKVGMAAADWETVERPRRPASAGAATAPRGGAPSNAPKRDLVLAEGTPVKVGDTEIQVVAIPGHTPGSLGFIFPVKDGGTTHTAALFGGAMLLIGRPDVPALQGYIASVNHFADIARQRGVDVEVQNHPLFDAMETKLAALKTRRQEQPHPFVIGKAGYQQFLSTITGCIQEEIKRRP
jgi:metallo-beta-lactamase class B